MIAERRQPGRGGPHMGLRGWRERKIRELEESLTVRGDGWALKTAGPPSVNQGFAVSVATAVNTGATPARFVVQIHVVAEGRRIGTLHATSSDLPTGREEMLQFTGSVVPGFKRHTAEFEVTRIPC
ncbi:hypothetical protein [Streptomyces sp. NPDC001652]|uniref:hypothetical protein n=1 Tax=Streptomyces sp. NPDC001652 TaxID=3154393 RepID=UPI00333333E6